MENKIMDKKTFILDNIDINELYTIAPVLMAQDMCVDVKTPDDIATYLYQGGKSLPLASSNKEQNSNPRPPKKIWLAIETEFNLFLCGDSPKYKVLWEKLEQLSTKTTTLIATTISVYLITILNLSTSLSIVIGQFVAILLCCAKKIGISSYCTSITKD